MLWQLDIYPLSGQPDRAGTDVISQAADLGLATDLRCHAAHGYLVEGELTRDEIERIARELLVDRVVEVGVLGGTRDATLAELPAHVDRDGPWHLVHVLPKPGVINPSLPYQNLNAVSMLPQDLPKVIDILIERLRESYPNVGELWTSAIGGWLTFPAACANTPEFLKTPVAV